MKLSILVLLRRRHWNCQGAAHPVFHTKKHRLGYSRPRFLRSLLEPSAHMKQLPLPSAMLNQDCWWPCSMRTLTCDLQLSRRPSSDGSILWSDRCRLFDRCPRTSPGGAAAEHPDATTVIVVGRWSCDRVGDTAWTMQEVLADRTDRKDPRETPEKEWRRLGRRSSPSSSSSSSSSSFEKKRMISVVLFRLYIP